MPTDWESRYQQADTPWDKAMAHPWLMTLRTRPNRKVRVLAPGCGRGHDLRELCRIFPDGVIVGADVSATALAQAQEAGMPANVELLEADVLAMEAEEKFDLVWEHTLFCAIEPELRDAYRAMLLRVLKPRGRVIGAFFLTMPQDGAGPPFNCEIDEFCARFSDDEGFFIRRMALMEPTFPGREGEEWAVMMDCLPTTTPPGRIMASIAR